MLESLLTLCGVDSNTVELPDDERSRGYSRSCSPSPPIISASALKSRSKEGDRDRDRDRDRDPDRDRLPRPVGVGVLLTHDLVAELGFLFFSGCLGFGDGDLELA